MSAKLTRCGTPKKAEKALLSVKLSLGKYIKQIVHACAHKKSAHEIQQSYNRQAVPYCFRRDQNRFGGMRERSK